MKHNFVNLKVLIIHLFLSLLANVSKDFTVNEIKEIS